MQAKVSRMAEVQKVVDGRAAADAARAEAEVKVRCHAPLNECPRPGCPMNL